MPVDLPALVIDLRAESDELIGVLAALHDDDWARGTPSVGWTVTDQVSHLAYFDETATLAATDPARFRREAAELTAAGPDFPDRIAARFHDRPPAQTLEWFRSARQRFCDVFAGLDPSTRLPWYGPDMGPASSVTARLMETWAHGQDVIDAVGASRAPTARLRHVADLGVRTTGFTHDLHGVPRPDVAIRVELDAPDGSVWTWGPPDTTDVVCGPAEDFCLVVTQRRHVDDTALAVTGLAARRWIAIAQAFAGAATLGPPPRAATG